jgi:hypothetical protein
VLPPNPQRFDSYAVEVEALTEAGTSFGKLEDAIDATSLDEGKSALWLLAWSLRNPAERRTDPVGVALAANR